MLKRVKFELISLSLLNIFWIAGVQSLFLNISSDIGNTLDEVGIVVYYILIFLIIFRFGIKEARNWESFKSYIVDLLTISVIFVMTDILGTYTRTVFWSFYSGHMDAFLRVAGSFNPYEFIFVIPFFIYFLIISTLAIGGYKLLKFKF